MTASPKHTRANARNVFVSNPTSSLSRLHRLGATGCATLRDEAGMYHRVLLRDGLPLWLETADEVAPLSEALEVGDVASSRARLLSEEAHVADVLATADAQGAEGLLRSLRECMRARLSYLFELGTVTVELVERPVVGLPPMLTIAEVFLISARAPANLTMVDTYVARLGEGPLELLDASSFGGLELELPERRVLTTLRLRPTTMAELETIPGARRAARGLIFASCLAGCVRASAQAVPSHSDVAPRPPVAPRARPSSTRGVNRAQRARREVERARKLMSRLAHADALKAVQRALSMDPGNTSWRALRVFLSAKCGTSSSARVAAISQLDAIIEAAPSEPDAFYYRAQLHLDEKQPTKAEPDLEKVVELDPRNLHARQELSRLRVGRESPPKPARTPWFAKWLRGGAKLAGAGAEEGS